MREDYDFILIKFFGVGVVFCIQRVDAFCVFFFFVIMKNFHFFNCNKLVRNLICNILLVTKKTVKSSRSFCSTSFWYYLLRRKDVSLKHTTNCVALPQVIKWLSRAICSIDCICNISDFIIIIYWNCNINFDHYTKLNQILTKIKNTVQTVDLFPGNAIII